MRFDVGHDQSRPWPNKFLQKFRNHVGISGDGNTRGARATRNLERGMQSFCIRPIKPSRSPGQRKGASRKGPPALNQSFLNRKNHMRENRETKRRLSH
jgi:hypothetical protein